VAKSPSEQIQDLKATIANTSTEVQVLAEKANNAEKNIDQLITRVNQLELKVAKLEERCAALEMHTDRGWNLTQALIILVLSIALSAFTSVLTQTLIKKP
jgi:chromosome segregation ATPase